MTKTALAVASSASAPIIEYRSPLLERERFTMMWQLAEAMARAKTLPGHLHGSAGDCLRVVEMADRCGQSPYALADHTFFVQGKLALDGQAMASLVNAHPRIVGSLRYEYSGTGEGMAVRVLGRLRGEDEDRDVSATVKQGLADSKGARQRWQQDPEQMLAYYGARKWARRHAPEVTMGLYTPDELRAGADGGTSMRDITPMPERRDFGGGDDGPLMREAHDPETGELDAADDPSITVIYPNGNGGRSITYDNLAVAGTKIEQYATAKVAKGAYDDLRSLLTLNPDLMDRAPPIRAMLEEMLGDEATGPVSDAGPAGRLV